MIKKSFFLTIIISLFFALSVSTISAQGAGFNFQPPDGLGVKPPTVPAGAQPYAEKVVEGIIINVIAIFYAVGGIGVLIYFVWGSVDWILSGGDKEKVAGARKKMSHAIIGLILLSLSYVIINLVGQVVGFNPLGNLQLRGLGNTNQPVKN